jgi:hypothetical protein
MALYFRIEVTEADSLDQAIENFWNEETIETHELNERVFTQKSLQIELNNL